MIWDKEKFNDFILENDVVGFFKEPLELKSGRISYWYVNWRNVAEDVFLIDSLSDFVLSFIREKNLNPDCFYGVPEGATKLGVLTQYKWARAQSDYKKDEYILAMGRAKPKEHGDPKDKYFLGVPKGNVIVLEDVTTTGGSILETIDKLIKLKVNIIAAIGMTNRNELRDDNLSVEAKISEMGVKYHAMSDAVELLPKIYERLNPGEEIAKHVEQYFDQYGINPLKLI